MSEILNMLKMNYEECCNHLKQKYGIITKNYFTNENCKYKNKSIGRGIEGLYIHHIDEDKAIMLSTPSYAVKNPFSYQHADRLVYCNLLEHLVLHIKILEYPHPNKNPNEIVGYGGVFNFIIPELNDIYSGINYKQAWKIQAIQNVINKYDDYLLCIEYLMNNFDYEVKLYLRSYNSSFGLWDIKNNKIVFEDLTKIYKKYKNI